MSAPTRYRSVRQPGRHPGDPNSPALHARSRSGSQSYPLPNASPPTRSTRSASITRTPGRLPAQIAQLHQNQPQSQLQNQPYPSRSLPHARQRPQQPPAAYSRSLHRLDPAAADPARKRSIFSMFRRDRSRPPPQPAAQAAPSHPLDNPPTHAHAPKNGLADNRVFIQNATIRPGGGGVVPQTDAPVNATNASARFLTIEYLSRKTTVIVDPDTRARDVTLKAHADFGITQPGTDFVLIEIFSSVGLQRPVRAFERVRDIMNSWPSDRANHLVLVPGTPVSPKHVSQQRPGGGEWVMKYSTKPGKWTKRAVALRPDGQIEHFKKGRFGILGKGTLDTWEKVCHLSDFDGYTPTVSAQKSKINPPDRFCLAVKSEQKSTLFDGREGFVHFWCTDESREGERFLEAVRQWRAWYRCWEMREGIVEKTPDPFADSSRNGIGSNSDSKPAKRTNSHGRSYSRTRAGDGPTGKLIDGAQSTWSELQNGPPTPMQPNVITSNGPNDMEAPFSAGGLLGRNYTVRQKEHAIREKEREREKARDRERELNGDVFTEGALLSTHSPLTPGLQRSGSINRTGSINRAGSVNRTRSVRKTSGPPDMPPLPTSAGGPGFSGPAPLVDLTPVPHIPPQHARRGHGVKPDPSAGGPLIDFATTPDVATRVPEPVDWRRPPQPPALAQSGSLNRQASGRNGAGSGTGTGAGISRSKSSRPHGSGGGVAPVAVPGQGGAGLVNYARSKSLRAGPGHGGAATASPMMGRLVAPAGLDDANAFVPGGLVSGPRYR